MGYQQLDYLLPQWGEMRHRLQLRHDCLNRPKCQWFRRFLLTDRWRLANLDHWPHRVRCRASRIVNIKQELRRMANGLDRVWTKDIMEESGITRHHWSCAYVSWGRPAAPGPEDGCDNETIES